MFSQQTPPEECEGLIARYDWKLPCSATLATTSSVLFSEGMTFSDVDCFNSSRVHSGGCSPAPNCWFEGRPPFRFRSVVWDLLQGRRTSWPGRLFLPLVETAQHMFFLARSSIRINNLILDFVGQTEACGISQSTDWQLLNNGENTKITSVRTNPATATYRPLLRLISRDSTTIIGGQ
jgi:hypothetical protein